MVTTTVEMITPAKAQEYLTKNINNRHVREEIVNIYADQMKKGLWRLSNDAICFTKSGHLINGQHRMMAICKSGVACQFNVSRGYMESDILVMDNGVGRSTGDILLIQGIDNSYAIASIVKRKIILSRHLTVTFDANGNKGFDSQTNKILNSTANEEFFAHQELYEEIAKIAKYCYKKFRVLVTAEYGGISAHLILDLNHSIEEVKDFFYELCGLKPETNNVITLLRNKLVNDKMSKTHISANMKQKLIIKTWNAYISGSTVNRLMYNENNDKELWFS